MVTQSTEGIERSGSREVGAAVRAIGGLVLALAVAAGIGAWQTTHHGAAPRALDAASHAAPVRSDGAATPAAAGARPTVYLVESVARQQALTELGLAAHDMVLVATTDEDAAQVRLEHRQPGVSVIDLRPAAALAGSRTPSEGVAPRGGHRDLYVEQATAGTAAPTIAILAGELAPGLVGITDGRLVAVTAHALSPARQAAAGGGAP